MTVGRLSAAAWVLFVVIPVAFLPLIELVHAVRALPTPVAIGLDA